MKKVIPMFLFSALLFSCSSDDDVIDDGFVGETKEYTVNAISEASIEGTLNFTENEDGTTTIDIELEGTEEGQSYPASLRHESAAEGGDIAVTLEPVDGATGMSTTTLSQLDDETAASFEELANLDGHLSITVQGEEEEETPVAVADLGDNQLTGESLSFELRSTNDLQIEGTASFSERESGETLVSIQLEGTQEGESHPAQLMVGSIEDATEVVAIELNPVNGTTGTSFTHVASLDEETQEGEAVSYEDLISYDGHLNVYLSETDSETVIAQGNIGGDDAGEE